MNHKHHTFWLSTLFLVFWPFDLPAIELEKSSQENDIQIVTILTDQSYLPYSVVTNGVLKGLLVDIVAAVNKNMPNYDIKLKAMAWPKAKALVKKGDYLALAGTYFHAHDWPYLYPYSQSLYGEHIVTVCSKKTTDREGLSAESQWPQDYKGLTIASVGPYDGWVDTVLQKKNYSYVNFFRFPTAELALAAVHKHIVNCALIELLAFKELKRDFLERKQLQHENELLVVNYLSYNHVYIGYSEPALISGAFSYASDFKRDFDTQLYLLQQAGQLKPLFEKYNVVFE